MNHFPIPIRHVSARSAMRLIRHAALALALASPCAAMAQVNAEQVVVIGRNVLSMQDYMLAIQYFNAAIKAKPYMADPYFYRALAKLQLDDYQGAIEDCTLALERNKFKVEAYKLRGFARQQLGLDSLAVIDYDEGLKHNPTDQYFLFYKGVAETELGRYDDSRKTFSSLLRQYPRFADGVAARARMKALEGDTLAAMHDLDKAIQLNRTLLNAWLQRSELRAKRGEWNEALEDMDEAVRMRPEEASFYINRAYLKYNTDDFYGAMSDYNYSLQLEPDNEAALFNRALLRLEVRDLIHAAEDFSAVLAQDPENFHALYNRGIARMGMEQYRDALTDFRAISQRYPKFYPVYYAMAECEQNMGDTRRALANMTKADNLVRLYVDDPTRNRLDRPTIEPGQTNEAHRSDNRSGNRGDSDEDADTELMDRFNRLVTVSQSDHTEMAYNDRIKGRVQDRNVLPEPEPIFSLSFIAPGQSLQGRFGRFKELDEYNAGNFAGGRTLYIVGGAGAASDETGFASANEVVESLTPSADRPGARPVDLMTRGTAHAMLRNYPAALADLNAAIAANERYTLAYMVRGAVRYEQAMADIDGRFEVSSPEEGALRRRAAVGMMAEALTDFERALTLNPRLAHAWYDKGCVLYSQNDFAGAAEAFSHAIALDSDLGQAWFNRGLCHLRTGHRAEAFSDLSKAGELGILPSYNLLKRLK